MSTTPDTPIPVKWQLDTVADPSQDYHKLHYAEAMTQRDNSVLYAVRDAGGWCLNHEGEWEYEPQPSSRDDAFMTRCRFASLNEAATAFRNLVGHTPGRPQTGAQDSSMVTPDTRSP